MCGHIASSVKSGGADVLTITIPPGQRLPSAVADRVPAGGSPAGGAGAERFGEVAEFGADLGEEGGRGPPAVVGEGGLQGLPVAGNSRFVWPGRSVRCGDAGRPLGPSGAEPNLRWPWCCGGIRKRGVIPARMNVRSAGNVRRVAYRSCGGLRGDGLDGDVGLACPLGDGSFGIRAGSWRVFSPQCPTVREQLAAVSGDVDAHVAVLAVDLRGTHRYAEIVKALRVASASGPGSPYCLRGHEVRIGDNPGGEALGGSLCQRASQLPVPARPQQHPTRPIGCLTPPPARPHAAPRAGGDSRSPVVVTGPDGLGSSHVITGEHRPNRNAERAAGSVGQTPKVIEMQPVLEMYQPKEFTLWSVAWPKPFGYLPLSGMLDPVEVGTAVMRIAEVNDVDPEDDRPPRPADPLGAFLHGLLTMEQLFAPGGLRITDTETGTTLVPGCCSGIEDSREWFTVIDGIPRPVISATIPVRSPNATATLPGSPSTPSAKTAR